jgi:hypothetical protein
MRRFVAKTISGDIEQPPSRGYFPFSGLKRINRITSGWRQHQSGRSQARDPIGFIDQRADLILGPFEATYTSKEMREALKITGVFKHLTAHYRRKAQDFGCGLAMVADESRDAVDDMLEERGSRVQSSRANGLKQSRHDRIQAMPVDITHCPNFPWNRLTAEVYFGKNFLTLAED